MPVKLSICIPTYNRGDFIGDTIESILAQVGDDIEIVVSDNASGDHTKQIIREFQQRFPRLVYFRQDENVGFDLNVLKAVSLASGEYCWLMSSDDRLEPGALPHILSQLERHPGLAGASVNQAVYLPDMRTPLTGSPVAGGSFTEDRLFSDAEACFSLLGLYIGYMSGQIVARAVWNEVASAEFLDTYCNGFIHVYMLGSVLKRKPRWLYIHKACVGYRSGNDSLLEEVGLYKRQLVAHAHYEALVRELFGRGSSTYNNVLQMALRSYMRGDLADFKSRGITIGLQLKLFALYARLYWRFPFFWLQVCPIFFIPNSLVDALRDIYRASFR